MQPILSILEQQQFETPPRFDADERREIFDLKKIIRRHTRDFSSVENRIGFLVQYGYFKAVQRFFPPSTFHHKDLLFVAKMLGTESYTPLVSSYKDGTVRRHKAFILDYFGFQKYSSIPSEVLESEVLFRCSKQIKPRSQFGGIVAFLRDNHIEIPPYAKLERLLHNGYARYKKKILALIEEHILPSERNLLDALLETDSTALSLYHKQAQVTLLKRVHHTSKTTQIVENRDDLESLQSLFEELSSLIEKLSLTPETIRYYAYQVASMKLFQVKQRDKSHYLYLIAFIIHHYYYLSDLLVDTLLESVNSATSRAMKEKKEFQLKATKSLNEQYHQRTEEHTLLLQKLREGHLLIAKNQSADELKEFYLKTLPSLEEIDAWKQNNETPLSDNQIKKESERQGLIKESQSLQLKAKPIITTLDFDPKTSKEPLLEAISYLKEPKGKVPTTFLSQEKGRELYKEGKFTISLYKIYLFQAVSKAIKGGSLNLKYSYLYRSLLDYTVSDRVWRESGELLLEQHGLSHMKDFSALENYFKPLIKELFQTVNEGIKAKENPYIRVNKGKITSIKTPAKDEEEGETTADLFPHEARFSLAEVLQSANQMAYFTDSFTHWNHSYEHERPSDSTLFGAIIAYGTNLGISRFAHMASGIKAHELEKVGNWYFSSQNIKEANDRVVAAIEELKLSLLFREEEGKTHTSSDGQKCTLPQESIYASYSPKYFGKGKGVSALSFVDESHRISYATVINASEREATYTIDGLMHNSVVQSDRHSTDTHGATYTIFALTHMLGIYFTPRIKNAWEESLYSFENPELYTEEEFPYFTPSKRINTKAIEKQWEMILRMVVSIKMKENTASQILKRVNSYSTTQPVREALTELGKMVKTKFLLEYFSKVELRQSTGRMLNNVENSHKLSDAIKVAGIKKIRGVTKEDLAKANDCNVLIQNCCILFNYQYLTDLLLKASNQAEKDELLAIILRGSPRVSRHINFHGKYDLSLKSMRKGISFDIEALKRLIL